MNLLDKEKIMKTKHTEVDILVIEVKKIILLITEVAMLVIEVKNIILLVTELAVMLIGKMGVVKDLDLMNVTSAIKLGIMQEIAPKLQEEMREVEVVMVEIIIKGEMNKLVGEVTMIEAMRDVHLREIFEVVYLFDSD